MPSAWSGSLIGRYVDDLPHWVMDYGVYAVTIRCVGSLPNAVVAAMAERWDTLRRIPPQSEQAETARRELFRQLEAVLDQGRGFAPFADARFARLMTEWIIAYNCDGLRFPGLVVMPNHVHLVTAPVAFTSAEAFARAWRRFKGASARILNREMGRKGSFWQRSWYDRWIRSSREWRKWMRYLETNPVRAGFAEKYPFLLTSEIPPE